MHTSIGKVGWLSSCGVVLTALLPYLQNTPCFGALCSDTSQPAKNWSIVKHCPHWVAWWNKDQRLAGTARQSRSGDVVPFGAFNDRPPPNSSTDQTILTLIVESFVLESCLTLSASYFHKKDLEDRPNCRLHECVHFAIRSERSATRSVGIQVPLPSL